MINENEEEIDYAQGGGIFNSGKLTLTNSTVNDNETIWVFGGGIANIGGTAAIINTTVSNNHAEEGNGVYVDGGSITLNNTTIYKNDLFVDRGFQHNGSATIGNSIVATCSGPIKSQGYNLFEQIDTGNCTISGTTTGNKLNTVANLGALANNGGATYTHRPQSASPILDGGNPATPTGSSGTCASKDQRGYSRPKDGDGNGSARCDIGAYERSSSTDARDGNQTAPEDELREIEQNAQAETAF